MNNKILFYFLNKIYIYLFKMSNTQDYTLNEQIYQNSDKTIRIYKVIINNNKNRLVNLEQFVTLQ